VQEVGKAADYAATQSVSDQSEPLPLCVDLDGTLVRSDTLLESLASGACNWRIWRALLKCSPKVGLP